MNFVWFSLFLIGFSSVSLADQSSYNVSPLQGISDIIDGIIRNLLETLRKVVPDPLEIPKISFSANNAAVNGSFLMNDFIGTGFRKFNISVINVNIFKSLLNIVINVPNINIDGVCDEDLVFGTLVPFYGKGLFNINLKDLQFNLTAKYTFNLGKKQLQIKNTTLITTISDAVFDIHGLIDNEAFSVLICQILDDTVEVFINTHTKLISTITSPIVETVFNKILSMKKKTTTTTVAPDEPTEATTEEQDFDPTVSEIDVDFESLFDEDDFVEFGKLFLKNLRNHPDLKKVFSFM